MARLKGFSAAALALCALAASAQDLQAGRDYEAVTPPLPTSDASKVVVTEFFSYACPHCFAFNPSLTLWENKLPKDVRFERVAVVFGKGPTWQKLSQLFYALEAIGKAEQLSPAVFGAVHVEHVAWQSDANVIDWVAAQGVDRAAFAAAFRSFSTQTFVAQGEQLAQAHRIRSVPTLVIDGKYAVEISDNGNFPGQLSGVDRLIEKARAEKKPR